MWKAFGRRSGAVAWLRGKRKVLSVYHQMKRRWWSRGLSERIWSVGQRLYDLCESWPWAKAKLKEIRALFNNYSYRQSIARDSEERQRFSERIISLILTVDAIQVVSFCLLLRHPSLNFVLILSFNLLIFCSFDTWSRKCRTFVSYRSHFDIGTWFYMIFRFFWHYGLIL